MTDEELATQAFALTMESVREVDGEFAIPVDREAKLIRFLLKSVDRRCLSALAGVVGAAELIRAQPGSGSAFDEIRRVIDAVLDVAQISVAAKRRWRRRMGRALDRRSSSRTPEEPSGAHQRRREEENDSCTFGRRARSLLVERRESIIPQQQTQWLSQPTV